MKNINYIINGVLAVAVVILFVLHFTSKNESTVTRTISVGEGASEMLPMAYVNVDSLLLNYNYSKDLYELLLKKQENARASLIQQGRTLERDVADFQRKAENNAFLSRERLEQEQQRLLKKQQDLQNLQDRTTEELMMEQQKMNEQLRDTVVSQLKVFNQDKGFQIIFSNSGGDNILLANDAYDITAELIEFMNKTYSSK